jgi:hypothetical protein
MKKNILFLLLFGCFLQISCSTDNVKNTSTTNSVDVYVAGSKNNHACYWKNNQLLLLDSSEYSSTRATKIIVFNDDVYVLGIGANSNNVNVFYPLLWKNGVLTDLKNVLTINPTNELVFIDDFDLFNSDIYLVGHVLNTNNNNRTLYYWKNNIKYFVHDYGDTFFSHFLIKKFKNDVYIIGTNNNLGFNNGVFKNGVFNEIPNSNLDPNFSINNNNLFVSGQLLQPLQGFYSNITLGINTSISFQEGEPYIANLFFDNNNMYYYNNGKIYKNGNSFINNAIDQNQLLYYDFIEFKILNDNLFQILQYDDGTENSYIITINGIKTMQINATEGEYISIFVVQN